MIKNGKTYHPINLLLLIAFIGLSACHSSRYVADGEHLYKGANIKIESTDSRKERKKIKKELTNLVRPKPNKKILGFYFGLWVNHIAQKEKPGKIVRYLDKRFGEEPVLMQSVSPERTVDFMSNRLENSGYFKHHIHYEAKYRKKKGEYIFYITLDTPFTIQQYEFFGDSTPLNDLIRRSLTNSMIKSGDTYDLEKMKVERDYINDYVKQHGYYFFNPDYLIFRADTNQHQGNKLNLFVSLKQATPEEALYPYRIAHISVYPDYSVESKSALKMDTVTYNDIQFIMKEETFKPKYLENNILFKPGSLYNQRNTNLTSGRLSSIGNYRFVNIRHEPIENTTDSLLDHRLLHADIYLSPFKRQALRFEIQALSKSNNFIGPLATINYRNRNFSKGGESLILTGKLGYETQFAAGQRTGLNSYEIGMQATYVIPRLVSPFKIKPGYRALVPSTKFDLSYSILDRVQFYRLNSVLATFGYYWSGNSLVSHEVNPVSINFVNISKTSEEFEEILDQNLFLRRSFEEQFIIGLTYTFQYNELLRSRKKSRLFTRMNVDISGNTLNALHGMVGKTGVKTIFNQPYSQYTKLDVDVRQYFATSARTVLVTRLFGGVGFSYGNSSTLPFIKQYFAGGPNSLRAFRIRSLGPGSYEPPESNINSFFDQSGDVKLEANVEWRFPMVSFLKGAVFVDAGNIWLLRENESLPGGKLNKQWYREIAVGTGFGFRVDITFFIIRLDLGTPLRKPFEVSGQRWISEFRPGNKEWRKNNLIWNLAIGYPF